MAALTVPPAAASEIDGFKTVELNVYGHIAEHCAMGRIGNADFGDLARADLSYHAQVQFSCNVPFDMKIQSAKGGLANDQYPNGQGPYAGTLPYTIDVSIPVKMPQAAMVSRTLQSRELMGAGQSISSLGGIAIDGLKLNIALGKPPSEAGLLAGHYAETVVITITPS